MNNGYVPHVNQVILVMSFILSWNVRHCRNLEANIYENVSGNTKCIQLWSSLNSKNIPLISKVAKFVKEGLKLISQGTHGCGIHMYKNIENIKWGFWDKSYALGCACPQNLPASPRTGIHIANLMCTSAKM